MRKRLVLVALAVAAMAVLPAGLASANDGDPSSAMSAPPATHSAASGRAGDDVTFYGSGWGHGVGMSQYGSQGLALQGWGYTDILKRYYTGTTVAQAPAGVPTSVRVGLTWLRSSLSLKAQGGPVTLRFGSPTNKDRFTIPSGSTWTVRTNSSGHFVLTNAAHVQQPPTGGPSWKMYAAYTPHGSMLQIPEAGHSYKRGTIEFDSYKVGGSYALRAIAILDPDQYLYGLGEVPNFWEMAALEVQAVAGRTYAFYVIETEHHGQRYTDCNCDLYPDSRSQSYLGADKENDQLGSRWVQAVNATRGRVVLYHGALILANYYSSSGGYTENSEDVWAGGDPSRAVPYLRSVCDPGDYRAAPPTIRTWTDTESRSWVGGRLGLSGPVTSFAVDSRSPNSGRIISITVASGSGARTDRKTISGPAFSGALGMMDDKVWINQNLNVVGAIRGEYDSLDCAPGRAMSPQFGVAHQGTVQRFRDGSIYTNPRVPSPVWLYGSIYRKYYAFGGARSVLALPRTGVIRLADPRGCGEIVCVRAEFDGGRIYDKGKADAHEIHGPVKAYWLNHGGAAGPLGFPTSDVTNLPGGGSSSTFERGTVTCPSSGACHG